MVTLSTLCLKSKVSNSPTNCCQTMATHIQAHYEQNAGRSVLEMPPSTADLRTDYILELYCCWCCCCCQVNAATGESLVYSIHELPCLIQLCRPRLR
ncbi:hypothetical protein E2C01_027555 [Portunus trituberculatus]|uniref:Uncharacterized protein n=1 Tax=Portunus trituberculatus TaxID=210409 RepID=A0A5B7EP07_PORTR|nr:hypothetical protein [Portunus trituberculatus]